MYQYIKIVIVTLLIGTVCALATEPVKETTRLKKTAVDDPLLNRARAYLDKGKLKIAVENYGIFSGTASPQGLWGDFQYISNLSLVLGVPGKDKTGTPYPWSTGVKEMFDIQKQEFVPRGNESTYWGPTVSESWMDRTSNLNRTDWEAVDEARIYLHNPLATAGDNYGTLGLYTNVEDQYPLIASSDLPNTWPGEEDARFWPGPWAIDPADTASAEQLKGVFVSDQDIYFEFNDRMATRDIDTTQGYSIGIKAQVSGFSYGASISEDIIFFKMTLINESEYDYENVFAGFYFDVDSYNRLANGSYAGRTNDDDMMSYNTEWDFGYIYDLDGDHDNFYVGDKNLAYSAVKLLDTPKASEEIDLNADNVTDIYPGDKLGLTSWHWFDWYFRPGARDESPNSGPWSGDGQTPFAANKEEIQYKILAGDTSNLGTYDSTYYFHPLRSQVGYGELNPRFDSVEGLLFEYEEGLDCVFIMGSGPFSIAQGDSVPFSFCIIMGEDEDDLVSNAKIAQLMYDNNYQGAKPPKAPNVLAKEEDEKVTLYWDNISVADKDIITGINDFEGFRIYRSEDNGLTWGTRMYDEESNITYWNPIAQFDRKNEIEGYEELMPHRFLGNESGLEFSFEDNDVENGREYLYAVCAYDFGFIPNHPLYDPDSMGMQRALNFEVASLENFLSNSTNLSHIVKAIPHRLPSNTEAAALQVSRKEGTIGNGIFNVEVIDPTAVSGDDYEILFDSEYLDPPANTIINPGSQTFTIINTITGDTLVRDSKEWGANLDAAEAPPIYDGLRWGVQMSTDIDLVKEDAYWGETAQCTYHLMTASVSSFKTRGNYELRFLGTDADTVFTNPSFNTVKYLVPFQLWNTTTQQKAKIADLQLGNTAFDDSIKYFVFENHTYEYPEIATYKNTFSFTMDWTKPDTYDEDGKLIPADIDWVSGDTLFIPVRIPFERGDGFNVNTSKVFQIQEVDKDNIKEVRVVPNPYIVHAGWESDNFVRKLQFTNLPAECKIHIFTVSGEKVITLEHYNAFDGSEDWDLLTSNRQDAAPGLYVYVVVADNGQKYTGKFVVIK